MAYKQPFRLFPVHNPRSADAPLALEGIRVVVFTRFLAGPACIQTLTNMGVEVIKIEADGTGDETRSYQPPSVDGEGPYFIELNRSKKGLCLNLAADGRKQVNSVRRRVVKNFAPSVMARLGLDYECLRHINPGSIYCAITGYGSGYSFSDQTGCDSVFQAESGFASLTRESDRMPMRTVSPVIGSAMNGSTAVVAALFVRGRTGI